MVADVLGGLHALWLLEEKMWMKLQGCKKITTTVTKVKGEKPIDGYDYSFASSKQRAET